ncbi:CapA family protein [Jeotgalibaca caeni]|uniref:CapA family protein n=1 Tax=Jeotgalibaca caeni TaxID=3028623 RepID=UPI00237DCB67|nr:CapA family protein [Jeotgalibaca caeni]MDE1549518.1 CapA family protein [Jeotgalibaca caeni]
MKKWIPILAGLALLGCTPNGTTEVESEGTEVSTEESIEIVESQAQESSESEEPEEPVETRISFVGVGDNLIHDSIYRAMEQPDGSYDFSPIYEGLAEAVGNADLAFLNQETILAGPEYPYSGYPAFNTPEEMATDMYELGFDLINGATNHTLDYDVPGAINAIEVWSQFNDLIFTGAYLSEEDRNTVRTIERNGVVFSFLAYTYGTNGIMPDTDWRVSYFDEAKIREDVAKAKEVSDVVIVSAHWGDENTPVINEFQDTYAQLFADLEVDVVIGTHPHIIQPIEWRTGVNGNEMLVVYSLGNLIAHSLEDFNTLGGMISFDFVVNEEETRLENVQFRPTVSHYSAKLEDIEGTRRDFKIYYLDEYTPELAAQHGLNGYNGIVISPENYQAIVDEIIPAEFLIKLN